MFRIENQDLFCSEVKFKGLFFLYNLAFFSDILKPIFPTEHRNLNAKSKESSGIEHLAVENSKYQ
jgi:hypothetical protein